MSRYKWLLDAGHGGVDSKGVYQTAPAKQFIFSDGLTIYEGVVNRRICKALMTKLDNSCIDYALVYDEVVDTTLHNRVVIANKIYAKDPRAVYLSIHSNAGGGSGIEVFTSIGQTKSDKLAEEFCFMYKYYFPQAPFRSDTIDGDADKESNFYVLAKTDCPSVLVENFFFDNRKEAEYLLSDKGIQEIANCLHEAIVLCEMTVTV